MEFKPNLQGSKGSVENIKDLIQQSSPKEQESIKTYILNTPMQIQTDYRETLQTFLENET